ncbi:MAG: DNA repair protein RecO [Paracoccus sp. (in: a-proteobacteria)]|nr:DNA repair protein RecO [Paracoccus sp. (in: a-proteobacteria)]
MDWSGEATIIARRKHGESAAIVEALTLDRGRIAGLVPGGGGRTRAAMLQPGSRVALRHRVKTEGQLGTLTAEPLRPRAGLLSDGLALDGLNATCALLRFALPEDDPHPRLAALSESLWDAMDQGADWAGDYVRWELALLGEMGFGLDLTACAVSGARTGLTYVSPRSGRAVSAQAAEAYAPRLLRLPGLLGGPPGNDEIGDALRLTGHFLHHWLAKELVGRDLPAARARLVARLAPELR